MKISSGPLMGCILAWCWDFEALTTNLKQKCCFFALGYIVSAAEQLQNFIISSSLEAVQEFRLKVRGGIRP